VAALGMLETAPCEASEVPNPHTLHQFQSANNYFTEMCSGFEEGSYLRLIDFGERRLPLAVPGNERAVVALGMLETAPCEPSEARPHPVPHTLPHTLYHTPRTPPTATQARASLFARLY